MKTEKIDTFHFNFSLIAKLSPLAVECNIEVASSEESFFAGLEGSS